MISCNPSLSLQDLDLAAIDFSDLSFVVSYGFDLARLETSVQALGLLVPPVVRPRADGAHQIICGYQRLLVLKKSGRSPVPARIAPPGTPDEWCLLASLHDNALSRGFNPMEAALMAHRLLGHFAPDTVCRQYLPWLGLPASASHLHKVLSLLNLEEPWSELAARKRLSVETAAQLEQWPASDRRALLPWFQALHLSHSRQLELVEFLVTLSRREGNQPASWLRRPELTGLLTDPVLSESQKLTRLWEILRHWCFPRASAAQHQVEIHLRALGLWQHPEIRLIPPPAFEDAPFRLELKFRDRVQLRQHLKQTLELLEKPDLAALLNL